MKNIEIDNSTMTDMDAYWSNKLPDREQFIKNSLRNDLLYAEKYDFLNIRKIVRQCDSIIDILEKNSIRHIVATLPSFLVFYVVSNENNELKIESKPFVASTMNFFSNSYLEERFVNDENIKNNGVVLYRYNIVKGEDIPENAFQLRFAILSVKMLMPGDIKISVNVNDEIAQIK